jgi:hypothetical protein
MKPLVYLAAPYSHGQVAINVHSQMQVFSKLLDDNIITPFPPLLSHLPQLIHPRTWEDWMKYDIEILSHCDACLRMPAIHDNLQYYQNTSKGADIEVEFCESHGIPVFYSYVDLYVWVANVYNM